MSILGKKVLIFGMKYTVLWGIFGERLINGLLHSTVLSFLFESMYIYCRYFSSFFSLILLIVYILECNC